MLSRLAFKLSVEKQYKDGVEKLIRLYQVDNDRKSRAEAEIQCMESRQKVQLLTRALRRYEDLYVGAQNSKDEADHGSVDIVSQRKPITGHVFIKIHEIAEVEYAVSGQSVQEPDKFVLMKVDHAVKGKTKATKTDRWTDEQHEFDVDKVNEIEFAVYERHGGGQSILVGLAWIRLSDLVHETSQKRVGLESNQKGRATAEKTGAHRQIQPPRSSDATSTARIWRSTNSGQLSHPQAGPIYIDAWILLEPLGRIHLTLGFTKHRKDLDVGLIRKGAVRQKKDILLEQYGHKFTFQTFYNIIRCALCGDFLRYTTGMQCADCRYTCHQRCCQQVVTKCISRPSAETEPDEEIVQHRIPHRFAAFSNIGASWCCHCGYMLPLSKRQARKCTECKLTCHLDCMHLIPNFCGMSMDRANEILVEMKKTRMSRLIQKNLKPGVYPQRTDNLPTLPVQDLIFPHTAFHENAVSHTGSGQSSSDFLHSKELAMDEQVPLETSSGRSSKQKPEQPPQDTVAPASTERKEEVPAPCVRTENRIDLNHFNFLAVLGKGNFGKVMLAETKTTKQLYAIKVLKKELVIQNNEVESIYSEKRVFLTANKEHHPFLYNLYACFQTETRICFVIEYISGGDLMLHIQREPFDIKRTKFYAAEVCLALKYFHENGIVYRDLKLDNVLLALDGHIKVADFGLCKENMWYQSTTRTFCGTSEFMAPEIVLDQEYGRAVDWWSFGILIYQMLLQQSPFRGEDEYEIYDAILEEEPFYPDYMPQDSVSILQKLLTRQPALRLGSGPTDAQEVMSHAFFQDVNWEDVYHKRIPAPFLPKVNNREDTSNFDAEFTTQMPALTPVQSGKYKPH